MISDPISIAALIAGATALAFWLDHKVPLASKIGASLLAIILGAILSNTGIVPDESVVYLSIEGPVTSLAIIYLLLGVRLADLKQAGPTMLGLFLIASVGTALGALAGALLFGGKLGGATWKLAGAFTGTYTGGSLNFAAVGRGLDLPASTFAAASAADAVTTGIWLAITLAAPIWLVRGVSRATSEPDSPPARTEANLDTGPHQSEPHPFWGRVPVSLLDLVSLAALGMAVLISARLLARWIGLFPEILWLTTLALLLAQLRGIRKIQGAQQLGNLGLHLFFTVIGIRSLIGAMLQIGPEVFYYTLVVVGIHGIFLFLVGRAFRGSVPMIAVVSQAAIGGPSTAMAIAVSRNWPALVLPGVAVGLLGYALGNYSGFGVAYLVRWLFGG
ncbi:MAG: DUF819 family protein [Gemmatimonadales bacterium]